MTTHRLRDVALVLTSNVDKIIVPDEQPVRLCNYVDVYKNNYIHKDLPFKLGSATSAEIKKFRVQVDDVIITKDSETADDIGVPALVHSTADDLICGYHLSILRADHRRMIGPFLYWHLLSKKSQEDFGNAANGVTRYGLTLGGIKSIPINLPDLPTQRAIADFLDRETARIDLLIHKKQRLVELLGEKYEATAAQLSTGNFNTERKSESGIDWLGAIPKSWRVEKLSWHFYAAKGKDAQKYTKEYCGANEGEFPVYSGQTANEGIMGRINSYDYDFGETGVLFATTVGAKAMDLRHLQGKFSLSQNCMIIIPRQHFPLRFFLYQMRVLFRKERQLIPDHMQASFRVDDLYQYRIAVPPLEQASEIGAMIEKAETVLMQVVQPVNASIDRLKEYRSALITAAVTGQIDVTEYAKSGTTDRRLDAIQEEMGA